MKAFWVIGDLGVITSNQQIKRDGIQEENFFNKQHNLPTKTNRLTHFISMLREAVKQLFFRNNPQIRGVGGSVFLNFF